jgi:hypothetical protein
MADINISILIWPLITPDPLGQTPIPFSYTPMGTYSPYCQLIQEGKVPPKGCG